MNRKEICRNVLLPILFALITDHAAAANDTLCKKNEDVFFSCSVGKKIISICSPQKKIYPAYLNYKFGLPGKIELNVKTSDGKVLTQFYRSEILGASNAATAIWFKAKKYHYVLTNPIKGDTTLEVLENNHSIYKLVCKSDFYGDIDAPNNILEKSTQSEYFKLYGIR
jgi:hypothetical protein